MEGKKTRRDTDRVRGHWTRLNVGLAFSLLRELCEIKGCETDAELTFLPSNISQLAMSCLVALA